MEREASMDRARGGMAHLERIGGEIHRLRAIMESLGDELADVLELTQEEIDLNIEFDFRAEELNRQSQASLGYRDLFQRQVEEAEGFAALAVSLKKESKRLTAMAYESEVEYLARRQEVAVGVAALDAEVKLRTGTKNAERARRKHQLTKKIREHEKRLEKLMIRAGRVKIEIERDVALYGKGGQPQTGTGGDHGKQDSAEDQREADSEG
jgi:hypothetical protein